jgi:hypothetical protein
MVSHRVKGTLQNINKGAKKSMEKGGMGINVSSVYIVHPMHHVYSFLGFGIVGYLEDGFLGCRLTCTGSFQNTYFCRPGQPWRLILDPLFSGDPLLPHKHPKNP